MSSKKIKEENQTENPEAGKSDGKIKKSADASPDAEAKEVLIKDPNNKEAKMADKEESKKQDSKKSNDDTGVVAKNIKAADKEKTEGTELAPNVTLDPQNEEQLDLNLMEDPVAVSRISVPTDDDQGEFLEDIEGVKEVRKFINENRDKEGDALKDAELLETGTEIISNFNKKLSFKEMITLAVLTKYFLLYGMALIILKDAVKEMGQNWMYYYKTNFIPSTYSSATKYMKLARVPDIIQYAFLGLERLEKIFTAIKDYYDMSSSNPFGKFFRDCLISIDLNESNLEKFKYDVDVAVAKTRINNLFEKMNKNVHEAAMQVKNTVDLSLIDNLISEDKKIGASLINDLYLCSKGGDDPNVLLKSLLKGGNKKASSSIKGTLTATKAIKDFPKFISELRSTILYISKNTALIQKITPQHVKDLQAQVNALKAIIKAQKIEK